MHAMSPSPREHVCRDLVCTAAAEREGTGSREQEAQKEDEGLCREETGRGVCSHKGLEEPPSREASPGHLWLSESSVDVSGLQSCR